MKVLFQNRPDALTAWGGDTTQMMQTRDALQKLGVTVDVCLDVSPQLAGYDLVHIFNIQTSQYGSQQMQNARRRGVPIVLSPIYWQNRHFYSNEDFIRYHVSGGVRWLARLWWRVPAFLLLVNRSCGTKAERLQRRMLEEADLLLPNSIAETEVLACEFDAPWVRAKSLAVPNGIAPGEAPAPTVLPDEIAGLTEFVLEVGRIEPIKGQLKLIEALYDRPEIPLVFLGRTGSEPYFDRCRELASRRGNVRFVPAVPHEQIGAFYQGAKVHVLPSLRESPGLVTLEASVYGANCVVSIHGPIMEYFGSDARVCDPADAGSVRDGVLAAWNAPRSSALRDRVLREFTWDEAARITLNGYRRVLAGRVT